MPAKPTLQSFAAEVVKVFCDRVFVGCDVKSWTDYENGNGTPIGAQMDRLIRKARKIANAPTDADR